MTRFNLTDTQIVGTVLFTVAIFLTVIYCDLARSGKQKAEWFGFLSFSKMVLEDQRKNPNPFFEASLRDGAALANAIPTLVKEGYLEMRSISMLVDGEKIIREEFRYPPNLPRV